MENKLFILILRSSGSSIFIEKLVLGGTNLSCQAHPGLCLGINVSKIEHCNIAICIYRMMQLLRSLDFTIEGVLSMTSCTVRELVATVLHTHNTYQSRGLEPYYLCTTPDIRPTAF